MYATLMCKGMFSAVCYDAVSQGHHIIISYLSEYKLHILLQICSL